MVPRAWKGVSPSSRAAGGREACGEESGRLGDRFVMATSSGALRRLLEDRGEVLRKDLVAFVPVNVREEGSGGDFGNQISGMLVRLHTDIANPEERLEAIAKDSAAAVGLQRLKNAKVLQNIPRVLGQWRSPSAGNDLGPGTHRPHASGSQPHGVLRSWPPIPLWLSGYRVASAAPVGPLSAASLSTSRAGIWRVLGVWSLGLRRTDVRPRDVA